jgi:hypothetical protein
MGLDGSEAIGDGTIRSGTAAAGAENAVVQWMDGCAFDALGPGDGRAGPGRAQLGAKVGFEVWMRSRKPASRRCGQAGSMPRALRLQEVRVVIADPLRSTALVLSERFAERAIGRIGSIVQRERVVSLVWSGRTR